MINHLKEIIEERLDDNNLTNSDIAMALKMSERNFTRKVKKITGESANRYIRLYRLKRAMDFIREGKYITVNEISHSVGFSSPDYFSRKFEEQYGKKPFELLQEMGWR